MKQKNYIYALEIILILILNLNFLSALELNQETKFLVLGHVYPDHDTLELNVELINNENPDFIVFLGDSSKNFPTRDWTEMESIMKKIKVPMYFAAGNHDILINPGDEEYFIENIAGVLFQSFDINNNSFLILNTASKKDSPPDIPEEQVEFIKSIYENNTNRKFIFMHHCLFYKEGAEKYCGIVSGRDVFKESNWNSKIVPLIQNQTLVFLGDVRIYFSYKENNIPYFGVGFSQPDLRFPPYMLKVIVNDEIDVVPIKLKQDFDADKIKYFNILLKTSFNTSEDILRSFARIVKKNLKLTIIFSVIFIIELIILIKILKMKKYKK